MTVDSNDVDVDTGISTYMHCFECMKELPQNQSPRDFARLSVGISPSGDLIVWCVRHDILVAHLLNSELTEALQSMAQQACACVRHGKKETLH